MRRPIIGVMGGGTASTSELESAYQLGRLIAENQWTLLNGGRNVGTMDASARGAHEAGGLVVGILPQGREDMSPYVDIPIITGMGAARNNINVLTSDVVIACAGNAGTLSEIALALKAGHTVILFGIKIGGPVFDKYAAAGRLRTASSAEEAINFAQEILLSQAEKSRTDD